MFSTRATQLETFRPMNPHILPVELKKSYRLINHGPTVLVTARQGGVDNVMAAAWCCGLDFSPPKLTVVIAKESKTREFIEQSGWFGIQVPTARQVKLTNDVGSTSLADDPDKLTRAGVELFGFDGFDLPFVAGCSAWLACRVLPEPHNQGAYDLFIGEVAGAWADDRVFRHGHWEFASAAPEWRSIHHIAGGNFYAIGEPLSAAE